MKGGMSAVPLVDGAPLQGDSFKHHIQDTLRSGVGLCKREVWLSGGNFLKKE
jgi:hypothetical protein